MTGKRYRIVESVGNKLQDVRSYEDLEKHHPTWKENPARRRYSEIAGEREEFVMSPSGERMISKDFVLLSEGEARVNVPSPVEGYARRSQRLDRWGTVQIYDGPGDEAKLIAQVRHMDPIRVSDGQYVQMGQPLGQQGQKSPPGTAVGLHTHMDIAESRLDEFRQYIRDLDTGAITTGSYPGRVDQQSGSGPTPSPKHSDALLKQGERGADVRHLQQALDRLGYHGAEGQALKVDGDFGRNTDHAVRAFQRAHGLHVDGVAGPDTLEALRRAERTPLLSERTHPDHGLYRRALEGIRGLPPGSFQGDVEAAQVAAALVASAKDHGLTRIDHVLMNTRGDAVLGVQGGLHDPARHHVAVERAEAASQSVEQSTRQLAESAASHQQSAQVGVQLQHLEQRGLAVGMRP